MNEVVTVILITLLALWVVLAVFMVWSWLNTPWYPSRTKHLDVLLNDPNFKFPKAGKFIDLGSGDGKVVRWAARQGLDAEGIEFNSYLTLYHKMKNLFAKDKTKVYNKSFFNHNYNDYDVVYLYIYNKYMDQLKDKLFSEMKPGSLIVSNVFKFSDVAPDMNVGRFKVYVVK